jgi:hypothetical protein
VNHVAELQQGGLILRDEAKVPLLWTRGGNRRRGLLHDVEHACTNVAIVGKNRDCLYMTESATGAVRLTDIGVPGRGERQEVKREATTIRP